MTSSQTHAYKPVRAWMQRLRWTLKYKNRYFWVQRKRLRM